MKTEPKDPPKPLNLHEPWIRNRFSLIDLQRINEAIYGILNRADFNTLLMVCRLALYTSRLVLWVRKKELNRVGYHLSVLLSWLAAVANEQNITLHEEVMEHCSLVVYEDTEIAVLQDIFSKRHEHVSLEDATMCLAEKVLAVAADFGYYEGTHDKAHKASAKRRMAQCIEAVCVVATLLDVDLHEEFVKCFGNGCNICHKTPCGCEHRTDKVK